mmetsp:Transcript_11441/g.44442  ORF Transcript_11441/g.44442 Transcript_11441/m.44442 type:complete len:256 (+) Transcript_11441:2869-3636(+)
MRVACCARCASPGTFCPSRRRRLGISAVVARRALDPRRVRGSASSARPVSTATRRPCPSASCARRGRSIQTRVKSPPRRASTAPSDTTTNSPGRRCVYPAPRARTATSRVCLSAGSASRERSSRSREASSRRTARCVRWARIPTNTARVSARSVPLGRSTATRVRTCARCVRRGRTARSLEPSRSSCASTARGGTSTRRRVRVGWRIACTITRPRRVCSRASQCGSRWYWRASQSRRWTIATIVFIVRFIVGHLS